MSQWNVGGVVQLLQDYSAGDNSAKFIRQVSSILTSAFGEIDRIGSEWTFMKRWVPLTFAAPYETGTVSVNVDGTAVTGSGTTFTSAMEGRWIRFNGESQQYLIASFSSTTSITLESPGYQGDANLSAVTYSITNESKALPKLFGKLVQPILGKAPYLLHPSTISEIVHSRIQNKTVSQPENYAIEWRGPQSSWKTARADPLLQSSEVVVPYLWLNPIPSDKYILNVEYYEKFPDALVTGYTSASTTALPFPNNAAASAFLEVCLAYLAKEQRESDWMAKLEIARRSLRESLGSFKDTANLRQREEWGVCDEEKPISWPWEYDVN